MAHLDLRWTMRAYSRIVSDLNLSDLLDNLASTAAARDYQGRNALGESLELKRSGFGAIRLPQEAGGRGATLSELFDAIFDLATAEPSLAHALRNHFGLVERLLRSKQTSRLWQGLAEKVAGGAILGLAGGEVAGRGGKGGSAMHRGGGLRPAPTLRADGQELVLDGRTVFSTGNIYSDFLVVQAVNAEGDQVSILLPSDRPGIEIADDWEGMGQRASGSGTTYFRSVSVRPSDILETTSEPSVPALPYSGMFHQLFLTTVIAGIAAAAVQEATTLVRNRSSNLWHGLHDLPRDEAELQLAVGKLSAQAFALRATVRATAASYEEAWRITAADSAGGERARHAAVADVVRAKIIADEISQEITSSIFDLFSGTSVKRELALDRHWRNVRTVSSHNPWLYKARMLGDHEINGTALPPAGAFF